MKLELSKWIGIGLTVITLIVGAVVWASSEHTSIQEKARETYFNIPWQDMAGMRDVLIHDYLGIEVEEVWKTATHDVMELKRSDREYY